MNCYPNLYKYKIFVWLVKTTKKTVYYLALLTLVRTRCAAVTKVMSSIFMIKIADQNAKLRNTGFSLTNNSNTWRDIP